MTDHGGRNVRNVEEMAMADMTAVRIFVAA
jgi:hypothetical protein